jgi:hypothetical protein
LSLEGKRELFRHLVATLAYRGGLAVSDAPENFSLLRVSETTRTAGELLAHICDLIEGSLYLAKGEMINLNSAPLSWPEDVARFFSAVKEFDSYLSSNAPLACPLEKLTQGPIGDALTHIGQVVMLRRLAGKPVRVEAYFTAEIVAGKVNEETFMKAG